MPPGSLLVSQAFFDVLDAQSELAADREAEAYAFESLSSADARYTAGMAVVTDKLQAQTAYSGAKVKTITAEGTLQQNLGKLNIAIGQGASQAIGLDSSAAIAP